MDRHKELETLINIELNNLERLSKEMRELLSANGVERSSVEVRAAGSILHDFYCGIEKIFERIAVTIDKNVPDGMNWHTDLLFQMGETIENARDRVLSEVLIKKLKEFLRFRHLFRHIYGFELKWERIELLCLDVDAVLNDLKSEIKAFL